MNIYIVANSEAVPRESFVKSSLLVYTSDLFIHNSLKYQNKNLKLPRVNP